jgi:hypothetical protein
MSEELFGKDELGDQFDALFQFELTPPSQVNVVANIGI